MKIPCEIVVWYVLPMVRKEIARELVNTHGKSQAEVARIFGVTDAAISQYLKKKRGDNTRIEENEKFPQFMDAIKESATSIASGKSNFESEMCRLCGVVRSIGLLNDIYQDQFGETPGFCANIGQLSIKT